ncbi:RNA-binding protein 47-like [Phlebotomus argentipes]|uniref:RNA-binding protein 47-like n=1 Tax=Phlebotomus argentipes TaxID=94469 RepID=UPI002892B24F|nr:RNA-binding protein 47-like [Phlebotomus argentipes]
MALDSYNISPDANDLEDQQNDEVYRRKFNLNYPIVQNNGCRQYGPPRDFRGHPPGKDCELFIHRIPKGHTEFDLLPALEKFGKVYQFRLMMDYCNQSRGYGYVVYCSLDEANRAFELLPHFIMNSGACLDVKRSYDKCRLFVGNLPQEMDPDAIKNTLKIIYPEMCNFIIHGRLSNMQKNRGFAFIDFPNHQAALRSKKKIGPGSLKLWDRQIRVVWAKEERGLDPDLMATVKTLFIRNIDLDATREFQSFVTKHFPMETILKITQVRDFAFVEFTTRLVAMQALSILSQAEFRGHSLSVEWALPSTPGVQSLQKRFDFDSILKLKCVANDWIMPVYIFGRILQSVDVQYVAVILRGAQMEERPK